MLYVKNQTAYEELIEIKNVPASGSEPEKIESTTLKDARRTYVPGRQDSPTQAFTFNRTATNYEKAKALCDGTEKEFLVVFSDGTGTYIKGAANVYKNEVQLNGIQEATLNITAVDIQDKTAAEVTEMLPNA